MARWQGGRMFDFLFGEGQYGMRFLFAFIVVLGLIALTTWLVRRFGGDRLGAAAGRGRQPRLAVIDAAAVDGRRRLILIRRDNVEHLLMIGGPTDVVVEANIVRAAAAPREAEAAAREQEAAREREAALEQEAAREREAAIEREAAARERESAARERETAARERETAAREREAPPREREVARATAPQAAPSNQPAFASAADQN